MLINAVIFVLQETLEAALLVSVLLALNHQQKQPLHWLYIGLLTGLICSTIYAANMASISALFDYVGQEVTNATLQASITLFIALYALSLSWPDSRSAKRLFFIAASASVACATTVEGSEILIYIHGFFQQQTDLQSVLTGSAIGFAIGLSIGVLLFYLLRGLNPAIQRKTGLFLLALFAGSMLSQAALQLTQADWIPATQAVWNSSQWLSESSVAGRLMYALVGYEATPSMAQIISYLLGAACVLLLPKLKRHWKTNSP